MTQVEACATTGIEDGSAWRRVLRDKPTNDPRAIAMEEGLEAAQVVSDVDPVVCLDVPVVILDPFRPGRGAWLQVDPVRGVVVLVHLSSESWRPPQLQGFALPGASTRKS
jgi:hypothetical protein